MLGQKNSEDELPHKVLILDPAVGTGTFLFYVIRMIYNSLKDVKGVWNDYVTRNLLPRIFGFEYLMVPYAVAHMKLELFLSETGYVFGDKERLGIYLTNSLNDIEKSGELSLFGRDLAREADASEKIKNELPIMVVIGNPPYSYNSYNKNSDIDPLLQEYYTIDGKPLGERNPKGLRDDYVKFIRLAQARIDKTGHGIIAFITNHDYLDYPTFRGMRSSLYKMFDDIYVLNLHGSQIKKEKCPDGSVDQNVFDIKVGVAISIFLKRPGPSSVKKVYYSDIWGPRDIIDKENESLGIVAKYPWLKTHDVTNTNWKQIKPEYPEYLFTPQDTELRDEYFSNFRIDEIFLTRSNGFKTHRDHIAIAFNKDALVDRISQLIISGRGDEELSQELAVTDTRDWSLSAARQLLKKDAKWSKRVVKCLYRPLDYRYCLYGRYVMDWPREKQLSHSLYPNICLATGRQGQAVGGDEWNLVFVGKSVADTNLFYRGGIQYFPLYLYDQEGQLSDSEGVNRRPNLSAKFLKDFSKRIKMKFTEDESSNIKGYYNPKDILYYIYAILHSKIYRNRYANYLKTDYPRIPFASDQGLFQMLKEIGEELVATHLLEKVLTITVTYPTDGSNQVVRIKYDDKSLRLWINKYQYFEGVTLGVIVSAKTG